MKTSNNMKKWFVLVMLTGVLMGHAKSSYVPTYVSYIHIVENGDTIANSSILPEFSLSDRAGSFRILIEHELMTQEKVKSIKLARARAGWATVSATAASISTAFSNNSLQYLVRNRNAEIARTLQAIYQGLAIAERNLKMEVQLENLTCEEIMVADMERGRIWYVQPKHSLRIGMNNPDVALLRISDINNKHIRFATIVAGSSADKVELKYEDEDFWMIPAYKREEDGTLTPIGGFKKINKHDYTSTLINYKQLQDYIQNSK
jgi:hypothetical protein